jgi:hypothetical protein
MDHFPERLRGVRHPMAGMAVSGAQALQRPAFAAVPLCASR